MAEAIKITIDDLPMTFQAKYLGSCKAPGAWGVKNIRKPVDLLVETAKSARKTLSPVDIKVIPEGLEITQLVKDQNEVTVSYKIETITYGVQDVNFSRIFCMIITKPEAKADEQYMLHAFACPSKLVARQITFALGAAFKHLAETMKAKEEEAKSKQPLQLKKDDDDDEDSEADA